MSEFVARTHEVVATVVLRALTGHGGLLRLDACPPQDGMSPGAMAPQSSSSPAQVTRKSRSEQELFREEDVILNWQTMRRMVCSVCSVPAVECAPPMRSHRAPASSTWATHAS